MTPETTLYAIGIKEAIGFVFALALLMVGGVGTLIRFFFQSTLTDIRTDLALLRSAVELSNSERRAEIAAIKDDAYKFKLYVEREFVKKDVYDPAIARLHERFDEVLKALAMMARER